MREYGGLCMQVEGREKGEGRGREKRRGDDACMQSLLLYVRYRDLFLFFFFFLFLS